MIHRRYPPTSARTAGFTIIETLIALAILSVLFSIAGMGLRPRAERTAANAVQSFIQQSRFDSIKTNRPVVITYNAAAGQLHATRMADSTTTACASAGSPERTLALADYRGVTSPDSSFAILWLPTGQPRSCPTGATPLDLDAGAVFRLQGPSSTLAVRVSSGGEVVLQ